MLRCAVQVVDPKQQLADSRTMHDSAADASNSNTDSFPAPLFAGRSCFRERPYWGNDANALAP